MVDQEQAKKLKVGDIIHHCPYEGIKCQPPLAKAGSLRLPRRIIGLDSLPEV